MSKQRQLAKAIDLMVTAFNQKLDRDGKPYVMHCFRVMQGVSHLSEDAQVAAILHDVLEDTDWTAHSIAKCGFTERSMEILALLTHDKATHTYKEYIELLGVDKDANRIKRSDLQDNSNITRLKGVTNSDLNRIAKYHESYLRLIELSLPA